MTKIALLVICLVIQLFGSSISVEVECAYEKVDIDGLTFYGCENKNHLNIISRKRTLDKHTGDHAENMTDDDVDVFFSENKNVQFFPQGLNEIFKNLKRIAINSNGVKELIQSDLKPYPKLEAVILDNNVIEVLDDGVFQYNPDLVYISLENNFLIQIYPKVFDGLNSLINLDLSSNFCINMKAFNDSTEVGNIIEEVKVQCSNPEFIDIDQELRILEANVQRFNVNNAPEFYTKFQKLYQRLDNYIIADSVHLNSRMQKLQTSIDVVMGEFYQVLFQKIENLEKKINKI